jgi:serine/threonine protein kinase
MNFFKNAKYLFLIISATFSCMKFVPDDRITAAQSLNHKFLADWSTVRSNSICDSEIVHTIPDFVKSESFSFEYVEKMTSEQMYHMLRCEILSECKCYCWIFYDFTSSII